MMESIPVVKDFMDVFPKGVPGLPPRRDIDFTIKLMRGASPFSRAPYQVSILELNKLKLQL